MARFSDLPSRLRETTEKMAAHASVDMSLWCAHSSAVLDAALKIEALEREIETLKSLLRDAVEDETEFETDWNKAARAAMESD